MGTSKINYVHLFYICTKILTGHGTIDTKLTRLCQLLKNAVFYYNWVGIYFFDKNENVLVLGPFAGAPSRHTRILPGRGVCGQVLKKKETLIVQDVSQESNYLSCSPCVQSEIVTPIMGKGEIIGEIDIDSNEFSPFTEEDKAFLEKIAEMIAKILK